MNHLHVHACVSTNVRDRPTALQDVSLRTSPIVANLLAVRDVQVARAVVRGRNRFGALHGWNVSTLHRHVGGTVHNGWRGHVVALHRDELGQNAAALVDGLKDELSVFVALCIVGAAFQIHDNVSTQSGNFFAVQLPFPAEPSAKSLVAVVVVGAHAKLKALGVRHGHVVQEQRALVVSCARQSAQHLHVEDRYGRRVHVAHLESRLRWIVGNQQRMVGVFSQPIRRVVFVDKTGVHMEDLVGVQHTMHGSCQSRTAAVGSVLERQRVRRVFHEVIGIGETHRAQPVQAKRSVVGVVLPLCQGSVPLGRGGLTHFNV